MLLGKGSCKKGERKQEEGRKERRNKMGEIDEKKKKTERIRKGPQLPTCRARAQGQSLCVWSFPRLTLN